MINKTNKKDLEGYTFLRNQIVHSGVTPSLREIGRQIGYSSPHSVQLMFERLRKRGLISYVKGEIKLSPRKRLASTENTINVSLVGSVACGLPSLAEQDPEAVIDVSTKIAKPGHNYFILRAKGTSMNKSGINDKDLVLVRQQAIAEEGEKVVALINDEATIKHYHKHDDAVVLIPNSTDKSHRPIVLSEEFLIQGVVTATLPANLY